MIAKAADFTVNEIFSNHLAVFDADTSYEIMNSNGSIEKLIEDTEILTRHTHDFKKVNSKEHKKNSNGSCKETIYEGQKYTICNQVIKGDIINEIT